MSTTYTLKNNFSEILTNQNELLKSLGLSVDGGSVVMPSDIENLQSQIDSINQKLAQIDFVKLSQLLSDSLTSETLSTEFDEVFDDYVLTNLE